MTYPILRSIVVVAIITLSGCKAIGLNHGKPETAAEPGEPAPASTETTLTANESASIEAAPIEPAPAPAQPAAQPKLRVAVLDPDDLENARIRHKQSLLESSGNSLADADVGYYMDVQKAQLIQLLHDTSVSIGQVDNFVILTMPGSDSFGSNSDRLEPGAQKFLTSIAQVLDEFKDTHITIYGHTDDAGEAGYNQKLSVRRALAVADYLLDIGLANERIAIVGYGETRPVSPNATPDGRAQNRRIEVHLDPLTN